MKRNKVTVKTLHNLFTNQEQISCLTAYDAQMGKLADSAGVHLILVGDSLGMTVLGHENTIPVTVDDMIRHTAAVCRGNKTAFVVGDLPFASYHGSFADTLKHSVRFLQEAKADAVKLEGGEQVAETIKGLVNAGIPVVAHIGLLPQSVLKEGGYRKYGKNSAEADQIRKDALAVQAAGALAVVLEGVEANLTKEITEMLEIPTIGIASGQHCSGQVQVVNDILGLFSSFIPKHTKRYIDASSLIEEAIKNYVKDITEGTFFNEKGEINADN